MFPSQTKEDTVRNLKGTAQAVRDDARETANDVAYDLRDAANKAGRRVRGFINHAGDELSHAGDAVTSQIRSNPVQSSIAALAVGFVLGALLRR